jgi:hypothetical protein
MSLLALSLSLLACDGGEIELDDTGPEADTDTDTDSDTDTDRSGDLTFLIDGEITGTAITLSLFNFGDQEPSVGDVMHAEAVTSATQTVTVAGPADDDLQEIDPGQFPDLMAAYYIAAVHLDTDADTEIDLEEQVVGVGSHFVVYLENVPADLQAFGLDEGWNALAFVEGQDFPDIGDVEGVDLPLSLFPQDSVSIGGTYGGSYDLDSTRFAAVAGPMLEGGSVSELLVDEAGAESWSWSVEGAPPEDHFMDVDGSYAAIELPMAYLDNDESGSFTGGDTPTSVACKDGLPAVLWYSPGTSDVLYAWYASSFGLNFGWQALLIDDSEEGGPVFLDESDRQSLAFDESCQLGGG